MVLHPFRVRDDKEPCRGERSWPGVKPLGWLGRADYCGYRNYACRFSRMSGVLQLPWWMSWCIPVLLQPFRAFRRESVLLQSAAGFVGNGVLQKTSVS